MRVLFSQRLCPRHGSKGGGSGSSSNTDLQVPLDHIPPHPSLWKTHTHTDSCTQLFPPLCFLMDSAPPCSYNTKLGPSGHQIPPWHRVRGMDTFSLGIFFPQPSQVSGNSGQTSSWACKGTHRRYLSSNKSPMEVL